MPTQQLVGSVPRSGIMAPRWHCSCGAWHQWHQWHHPDKLPSILPGCDKDTRDNKLFPQCSLSCPVLQPRGPQEQPAVPPAHAAGVILQAKGDSPAATVCSQQLNTTCRPFCHTCALDSSQTEGPRATLRASTTRQPPALQDHLEKEEESSAHHNPDLSFGATGWRTPHSTESPVPRAAARVKQLLLLAPTAPSEPWPQPQPFSKPPSLFLTVVQLPALPGHVVTLCVSTA